MKTRTHTGFDAVTAVVLSALVLLVTVGCGSQDSTSGTATTRGSTTQSSTGPSQGADQAVSVVFTRSGGLRPVQVHRVYSADAPPPPGSSKADVAAVLEAASDPALREAQMKPVPKNTCCDRQSYTVTITYADGSSTSLRSLDGLQQPQVFQDLLSKLG